jgi:hypothetical protein
MVQYGEVNHIETLKSLDLREAHFAVFASGVMAALGLRPNKDLDIIVTRSLWNERCADQPRGKLDFCAILAPQIEAWVEWIGFTEEQIEQDLIGNPFYAHGIPFVRLGRVIEYKELKWNEQGSRKDLADVEQIRDFLARQNREDIEQYM